MFWKKEKKNKEKYKPKGRLGYYNVNASPYDFTIVVEKLCDIGDRSRVKLLEINKNCNKSDKDCLDSIGFRNIVLHTSITWETDEQYNLRINNMIQEFDTSWEYESDIDYSRHETNPFRHNFVPQHQELPQHNADLIVPF